MPSATSSSGEPGQAIMNAITGQVEEKKLDAEADALSAEGKD